jgi:hypothetical protein
MVVSVIKKRSSEDRNTKTNTYHVLHKEHMADIGQCGNNTGLRKGITAAYIKTLPKTTLDIKGPRNTIETSVFK